jgi:hypothetical protein
LPELRTRDGMPVNREGNGLYLIVPLSLRVREITG